MRDEKRSDRESVPEWHRDPVLEPIQQNILVPHQLAPRTVCSKEVGHARHRIDRYALRAQRFVSEEHQARVVPDVGMGEKDPIQAGRVIDGCDLVQPVQLLAEVRRRLEQPAPATGRGHEAQTGREPPKMGVLPCGMLLRTGLRDTSVLRDPQHDYVGGGGPIRGGMSGVTHSDRTDDVHRPKRLDVFEHPSHRGLDDDPPLLHRGQGRVPPHAGLGVDSLPSLNPGKTTTGARIVLAHGLAHLHPIRSDVQHHRRLDLVRVCAPLLLANLVLLSGCHVEDVRVLKHDPLFRQHLGRG